MTDKKQTVIATDKTTVTYECGNSKTFGYFQRPEPECSYCHRPAVEVKTEKTVKVESEAK